MKKFVVAENFQKFKYFLENFAIEKVSQYGFVANENWRGISPDTMFILFDDYQKNEEWRSGQFPIFLSRCSNVYIVQRVQYVDYVSLVKE
jgi:hypothetical protein